MRQNEKPISRTVLFYIAMFCLCGLGLMWVLKRGAQLESHPINTPVASVLEVKSVGITSALEANLRQPLGLLLLQLLVVLAATRGVGALFRKWKQPLVIGEMVAGIMLGPSLLGWLFPGITKAVFPDASLETLSMMSQLGVILFMFSVGAELEINHLKRWAKTSLVISHAGIAIPFVLGSALALVLYRPLAPPSASFVVFALFMGVGMSFTAFPVLARIIEERGLGNTPLGNTAITCAAIEDVTAWSLLALIITIAKSASPASILIAVVLTLLFAGAMLYLVKPSLARLLAHSETEPFREHRALGICLFLVLGAAFCTQAIGIYVLFGAFLAGAILPRDPRLITLVKEKLATLSSNLLLPLFFAFTGLRTQVGLLGDVTAWGYTLAIIGTAIAGKLGGCYIAARWSGMTRLDAFTVGSLMNTRGLVELIVLNIGYDLGVFSPSIFAMLVLMALATTLMTSPLLSLTERWRR
ncbi:MAG: cation:proton antiporter [Armatimonadetes bacterium]|nr:cation:proton antiporter [Armatimonadota bacterium]